MNITFDDNLITGNKTIDSQHQELIDRIRQFVAACESGDSKIKAIKMLDYLDEYTNFHFQEEEELQKKVSYPEPHSIAISVITPAKYHHHSFIRS